MYMYTLCNTRSHWYKKNCLCHDRRWKSHILIDKTLNTITGASDISASRADNPVMTVRTPQAQTKSYILMATSLAIWDKCSWQQLTAEGCGASFLSDVDAAWWGTPLQRWWPSYLSRSGFRATACPHLEQFSGNQVWRKEAEQQQNMHACEHWCFEEGIVRTNL